MDNWDKEFLDFVTGASNPTDCASTGQLAAEQQAFQETCESNSEQGDPPICCTWIANGGAGECQAVWQPQPYTTTFCDGSTASCDSFGIWKCDQCYPPSGPCCNNVICPVGPVGGCICSGDCQCGTLYQTGAVVGGGPDCNPPGTCATILQYQFNQNCCLTQAPATPPPTTPPPTTSPPNTPAPTTPAPTTPAPTTPAPTTPAPTTPAPTNPPVNPPVNPPANTPAPTSGPIGPTQPPATPAPTTPAPTTPAPTSGPIGPTQPPSTPAPTTPAPTTPAPTTPAPTTPAPTSGPIGPTQPPATGAPSTGAPSTGAPSTGAPSTGAPSTGAPIGPTQPPGTGAPGDGSGSGTGAPNTGAPNTPAPNTPAPTVAPSCAPAPPCECPPKQGSESQADINCEQVNANNCVKCKPYSYTKRCNKPGCPDNSVTCWSFNAIPVKPCAEQDCYGNAQGCWNQSTGSTCCPTQSACLNCIPNCCCGDYGPFCADNSYNTNGTSSSITQPNKGNFAA